MTSRTMGWMPSCPGERHPPALLLRGMCVLAPTAKHTWDRQSSKLHVPSYDLAWHPVTYFYVACTYRFGWQLNRHANRLCATPAARHVPTHSRCRPCNLNHANARFALPCCRYMDDVQAFAKLPPSLTWPNHTL
jgi:hypothetical protein